MITELLIRARIESQGFCISPSQTDPQIFEPEFYAVQELVRDTSSFWIDSGFRRGRLVIWNTSSLVDTMAVSTAFNQYLNRIGGEPGRFYIYGSTYILLNDTHGWDDSDQVEEFLKGVIPES